MYILINKNIPLDTNGSIKLSISVVNASTSVVNSVVGRTTYTHHSKFYVYNNNSKNNK